MSENAPGDVTAGHYFQTLDRVHVASRYLQAVFECDPVLARHPEFRVQVDRAVDALEQLYQDLGATELGAAQQRSVRPTRP